MFQRTVRLLTFSTLILLSSNSTAINYSSAAAGQNPIDPACVESCRQRLFDCISAAQTNGEERRCIAVYQLHRSMQVSRRQVRRVCRKLPVNLRFLPVHQVFTALSGNLELEVSET